MKYKTPGVSVMTQKTKKSTSIIGSLSHVLPRSLFARSLLILLIPVIIAQMVATFIFYNRHWQTISSRMASGISGEIALIIELFEDTPDPVQRAAIVDSAARTLDLIVTLEQGQQLQATNRPPVGILEQTLAEAMTQRVQRPFRVDKRVLPEWYEIRVQLDAGVLRVLSPERRLFSPTSYIFILWMTGSSAVLAGIGILFMRNQIRPIRRLARAAEHIGTGREVENFRPEGATEVRKAAVAFLRMRARIQRQIQERTEILAGVSHDLRTPITRMRLLLSMQKDSADVAELRRDVSEMEAMIEGYLSFARGDGTEPSRQTDLSRLLRDIAQDGRREGGQIVLEVEEGLVLDLRANAIRRAISNLVSNAIRYAGTAWVTAGRHGPRIDIHVDDDGPGIPSAAREDVFRPFFRLDESRNQDTGGIGLGLAIARDAARAHGGDLLLGDSPKGGLRATIRLPI